MTVCFCLIRTLEMPKSNSFGKEDIVKGTQEGCLSRPITPPRGSVCAANWTPTKKRRVETRRFLLVDDTRLEPAGAGASARRPQSDPRASRAQIGHKLKTHTFTKKNSHPVGWLFFLVDDTRLELVTSRTSSGCATSCANRPSLFQLGHFTSRGITCQVFFQRKQKKTAFFCALRCT